ncbi:Endo/exonuclease/phosphatase domain-containing protein [Aphis craccivora]|uniref:Endo/exonuclease/phosphatase domain-containing protein n=1 Tax=Aphis craccivora TaxID=307492 RepID=A0A6G0ZLT5_APHCR|nr:Endo/exonuclease/phosphatase domain-containing protein [Aphis craccivora]
MIICYQLHCLHYYKHFLITLKYLVTYRVSSYNSYLSNKRLGESNLWKATKRLLIQDINTIPVHLRTDAKFVISYLEKCVVFSNMYNNMYNTFSTNLHICNPSNDLREIVDHIKTSSKYFHTSLLNSSDSLHYNFHVHPPQRRLKRGRPHDLLLRLGVTITNILYNI